MKHMVRTQETIPFIALEKAMPCCPGGMQEISLFMEQRISIEVVMLSCMAAEVSYSLSQERLADNIALNLYFTPLLSYTESRGLQGAFMGSVVWDVGDMTHVRGQLTNWLDQTETKKPDEIKAN